MARQTTAAAQDTAPPAPRHTPFEDAQALAFGGIVAAFAAYILASAGLITGQLAGLALLIAQAKGWNFGLVYLVLSLPFYGFGYRRLGAGFVARTLVAVLVLVGASLMLPRLVGFSRLDPGAAAILGGMINGTALLALFRHRASLGGIGAVALDVQDRWGLRAGWVQMAFDAALFLGALTVMPWQRVAWSALGAAVLNLVIAVNHRRDRYIVQG